MRIMISQPMNNKTNNQIKKERKEIIENFNKMHIEVLNTLIDECADPKTYNEYHPALFYLAKSIDFMAQVDAVYFMDGWNESRGCRIEHKICKEYGIKILDYTFFNNYDYGSLKIGFKPEIHHICNQNFEDCMNHIPVID